MNTKAAILVVEDEKNIRELIGEVLEREGYRVTKAENGQTALSCITSQCPDLILLDLGLPDMDGMEIIRQVRSWSGIPILVISARTQEKEKVQAFDLGADDYVVKPISAPELLARIRVGLRHAHRLGAEEGPIKTRYQAGDLVVDYERHRVLRDGQEIHLTQIEFKILMILAKNAGRVITYDGLIRQIWGPYADSDNRILRVNMAHIRRKIEPDPAQTQYIFTEVGIGYRMREEDEERSKK